MKFVGFLPVLVIVVELEEPEGGGGDFKFILRMRGIVHSTVSIKRRLAGIPLSALLSSYFVVVGAVGGVSPEHHSFNLLEGSGTRQRPRS